MTTAYVSITFASDFINGIAIAGFLLCAIMVELTNVNTLPSFRILNRSLFAFALPLSILFAYIVLIWVVKIIIG